MGPKFINGSRMGYVQVLNVTYMLHLLHASLDHGP